MTTGLVWLIWRRQRVALILSAVLAVASAVTLIILHAQLVAAAQAAGLAHCLDTPCDRDTLMPFREATMSRASLWSLVLAGRALGPGHFWATVTSLDGGLLKQSTIAPLVGLICGVGLFGREFDQRTRGSSR